MTLSLVVITRNEAANLRACLQSVPFADEIVVLDSGSTDDTTAIASECGARVTQTADWPGFGPQKNRALALATCDWVLSLDADERVTPQLAAQLQAAMAAGDAVAFEIPPMRMKFHASRASAASGSTIAAGRRTTYCACSGAGRRVFPMIWSMRRC